MRLSTLAALFLLLPVIAFAAPSHDSGNSSKSCQSLSKSLLHSLQTDDFKMVITHFDPGMKKAATPDVLRRMWKKKQQKFGAFEKTGKAKTARHGEGVNVYTRLQFAHGRRMMNISCNAKHQIQGLFFDPAKTKMSPNELDAYTGKYRLAPNFVIKIFRRGDQLYAQATGQSSVQLYPTAKDEFFAKVGNIRISFQRGASGRVDKLVLHQHGDHQAPLVTTSSSAKTTPPETTSASPAMAPPETTAWIGKAAVGAKTLPITVQRSGFALKGVLDIPSGKGPFGVVDIIPGSGPVNINGNGHDSHAGIAYSPYKKLAAAMVKGGWAVARVAKRYMSPSTGDANHYVFSDQVADNLAIVEALRKNPHVNPNRIVVAGHSLGGLLAPKLANETQLAGLILLEAPGENMKKILDAQSVQMAQNAGASATAIAAIKQDQIRAYAELKKAKPGQAVTIQFSKGKKTFPANQVALFKSWFAEDVLATARKVKIPVLVVQGGMDFNVPPGNSKRLVKAIPDAKLLYLPQMGHALDIAHCRCVKQLDTGKDAKLAPGLTDGIIQWLKRL
jgi:pimeloyl-ACP methyl ester carboxylesterase